MVLFIVSAIVGL